jgi:hypothetical protein
MNRNECEAIRPLISAALDGELDDGEFVQLSEHLASCDDCRQIHQEYTQLRNGIRSTPRPAPPPQLARNVWQETIEKPPPGVIARLASRTSVRFGVSTMAASVVALLVAVLFVAHGYDQRSIPTVAGSNPEQEATELWPVSSAVEIEFSKQMDRDSVEANLRIGPTAEQDRLPISWSGNSLIIGRSEDHSVLLRPETDYRITILEHATDRHGNALANPWVLNFRTGPTDVAVPTPQEDEDRDLAVREADPTTAPWNWLAGGGDDEDAVDEADAPPVQADPDNSSENREQEQSVVENAEPAAVPQGETNTNTEANDDGQSAPEPTVTPEPTQPESTPTAEPTSPPEPDPTPEPVATEVPQPTPTPEPVPVRGALGEVYWGRDEIRSQLGEPSQEARTFVASEQEFQRGMMFRQYFQNRDSIFVFVNGGTVQRFDNSFDPARHELAAEVYSEGLFIPGGYFGKVWSEQGVVDSIGYSVTAEPVENIEAAIQEFANGILIYSRGRVYAVYTSGAWDVLSVRSESSGGYQGEDPNRESDLENPDETDDQPEHEPEDDSQFSDHETEGEFSEEHNPESP